MTRILISTTAIVDQGLGHFMRSCVFLKELLARELDCRLHVDTSIDIEELIAEFDFAHQPGFSVNTICIDSDILAVCAGYVPDIVIFDRLKLDERKFQAIRNSGCFIASLSPIFSHNKHVDAVFTRESPVEDVPGAFSGIEYTIFNHRVCKIPDEDFDRSMSSRFLNVAINMGGGDKDNKTSIVIEHLATLEFPILFWIFLGYAYNHSYDALKNNLKEINSGGHEFILVRSNQNMWNILRNCSACVLSGGLTALEAIYAGLPSYNLYLSSDHEKVGYNKAVTVGATVNCGVFSPKALHKLDLEMRKLNDSRRVLREMRNGCKKIELDAKGAERVVMKILKLAGQEK